MSDARQNETAVDYHFGPYKFDGRLRRLYRDNEPLALTPKALDTLAALLERAGSLVEKDDLLRAVWNDVFVGEDTLAQNISTLRRVLSDDPNSATVHRDHSAPRLQVHRLHSAPSRRKS